MCVCDAISIDAFKATVVDNPLQLVTQFVTSANLDKYQIHLRDKILVAHAGTYQEIYQDWLTLEEKVNYVEILNSTTNPNKVQAILDIIDNVRKEEQKSFGSDFGKQVIETVSKISAVATSSSTVLVSKDAKAESDGDDEYQGDTENHHQRLV